MNEPLMQLLIISTSIALPKFSQLVHSKSIHFCLLFFLKRYVYIDMELQNIAFEIVVDFIILKTWLKHILMKREKLIKPF